MVAVVAGNGFGLFNTSLNVPGGAGMIGQGRLGQYGGASYVNAANGNLILRMQDERLSGRGLDMLHLRTYNAQGQFNDGDGDGWRWDGERRLVLSGTYGVADSMVTRTGGDGHETVYAWDGTRYTSAEGDGAHDGVVFEAGAQQWVWTDGSARTVERYRAADGLLVSQTDASGNAIVFDYANGRLSGVTDVGSGQALVLTYAPVAAGSSLIRLQKVESRTLNLSTVPPTLGAATKEVEYGYDSLGRLTSVKTDLTPTETADNRYWVVGYTYDGTSFRIASVTQSDGTSAGVAMAVFTYEQVGTGGVYRVKTVSDASGMQSFDYATPGQTRVTDANGQVWAYVYDAQQRLIEVRVPPATTGGVPSKTVFDYDTAGNVIRVTDALGRATVYAHDAQGNRVLERDALGNTLTRTYDAQNRLTTETRYRTPDPDGVGGGQPADPETVRYAYDAQSRIRFVVSAEGRVSENRYTATGQLERSIQYAGGRYDLSTLASTEAPDEAQVASWVSNLSAVDKRQAQLSRYEYDPRGNLTRRLDHATVDDSGQGVLDAGATVTEYVYDGYGQLSQTIAVRGSGRDQRTVLTSLAYDGLGREVAAVNASGTRTTTYDDANRRITTTNGSGLSTVQTYDALGRLSSVSQSASGATRTTQYVYDAAGRLRMTEDAQGGRGYSFYDAAGRVRFIVDTTGAVMGMTYDANGRMIGQTQYLNRASTAGWYVDGAVTKTDLSVGGAGSDVVENATFDRRTGYAYDEAGRLIAKTDAANTTTATVYDGASRIVREQTGDRVTRYFYDRDGRQVGVLDPLGYLAETRYDGAGHAVETIRYATASPQQTNIGAPVWVGVTNRALQSGQPFEYRLPMAHDPDGDTIAYSVVGTLPAWLSFDAATLTLRGIAPTALGTHGVTLRASDQRGTPPKTTDVTVQLTIANSAPTWSEIADRTVAVNASGFGLVLPAATDTNSTPTQLVYSIPAALLPPGMTFNAATRTLSGAPTTPGSYMVTARVTDAQGAYTERSFLISVTNQGPGWAPVAPQQGRVNTPFSLVLPAAVDPEGQALIYSGVSLPPGLSLSVNATGQPVISGTPSAPSLSGQPYSVVLKATDPGGEEVRLTFSLDVRNDPPRAADYGPWEGSYFVEQAQHGVYIARQLGQAYDPEGQGVTYTLIGSLPPGLQYNAANNSFSGTATSAGTYSWVVRASDPHGASADRTYTMLLLNTAPVFTPPSPLPSTLEGEQLIVGLSALFGDANNESLTYTIDAAPAWLHVSGSVLTGTAPQVNSLQGYNVTIRATDSAGAFTTGTFRVQVFDDGTGGGGPPLPQSVPLQASATGKASALPLSGNGSASGAVSASAALPPLADVLASWRPADTAALRSYRYYDGQGRVVGTVDERGYLSETVYDVAGNRLQERRYLGASTVDAANDTLESLKLRAGASRSTTTSYDGFGRVSTQTGMDGSVSRNVYDSAGRLVRQVWAEGTAEQRASRTRYNAFDEATGTVAGVGEATLGAAPTPAQIDAAIAGYGMRYEYDSFGRRVKATDANNNPSWYYYDREGRLSHAVSAAGEVSETVYNRFGQAESVRRYATRLTAANLATLAGGFATDAFRALLVPSASLDRITAYEYDTRGLLTKQTDAEGYVTSYAYTQYGQLAQQVRAIASGRATTTRFGYDLRGLLIAQTGDVAGINLNSRTVHDAYGRMVQSIDGAGKVTRTDYNDSGRTIVVTDPLTRTSRTEYDAFSRVLRTVDGHGQATNYAYDDAARSVTVTTPEGITVTTTRNRHGQTLKVVDGRGNETSYSYDANGALKQVKDGLAQVVTDNTYDASGRLIETKDARGTVVKLTYDAVDRVLTRQVDPTGLNLRTQYAYSAFGQQLQVTEGLNSSAQRVTGYQYDRLGRLVRVLVDPNGLRLSTRYTYDGLGNTVTVEQGTIAAPSQQVTRHEFDNLGRRVKRIEAPSNVFGAGAPGTRDLTTEYRYDAAGRLSRTIDALGQSTWYVYDAAGQQIQSLNALGELTETGYDGNGRVVHVRRYYKPVEQATLNGFGDSISPVTVTATAKDQRSYLVHDKDGRQRYTLTAVSSSEWTIVETRYDANGNAVETIRYDRLLSEARVTAIAAGGITASEVSDELTRPTNAAVPGLGYTDEASLATTQRTRFAYDAGNRLRFAVDALGGVSETVYDAGGLAVAQVRYAAVPALSSYTEAAIDAAVLRTNALNRVSRHAYDAAGRLRYTLQVTESDAQGKATQHLVSRQEYDALGRVVMSTTYATALGAVADYKATTLDAAVRVSVQDRRSANVYDVAGRQVYRVQVSAIDIDGKATKHIVGKTDYDALGRVVKTTAYATEAGAIAAYTLAGVGAAASAGVQDRSTDHFYDAAGRQRFVIAADGSVSETVYDALGRVREQRRFAFVVDKATAWTEATLAARRSGRVVGDGTTRGETYVYDRANRVLSTTDALGKTESWTYNALGEKETYTNRNGAQWKYTYDRLGRLTLEESPALVYQLSNETAPGAARTLKTLMDYDAFGNVTGRREAYGTVDERTTTFVYDRLGRQIRIVEPGWYDPATGQVYKTSATGRFQRTTEVMYDTLGDAVRNRVRTGASTYTYQYTTYDRVGRQVHAVDALNNVTTIVWSAFGERAAVTRQGVALGSTAPTRGYWTAAEVTSAMAGDALARTAGNTYDNLGRLIETRGPTAGNYHYSGNAATTNAGSITPASGTAVTKYEYTVFGQVHCQAVQIDATRWNETWHYYDAMGRDTCSIDALGHHTVRSYDASGNLIETVEYATAGARGASGQYVPPALPAEHASDRIVAYVYDARNQQTAIQRKNLHYAQLNAGDYMQVENARDAATTVQTMTYDGVGRVLTRTDALGNTTTIAYDALGRAKQVTEPSRTIAGGGADPFRNQTTVSPTTAYTCDAYGKMVRESRGVGSDVRTVLVVYDFAGNAIRRTDARGSEKVYTYDHAGRVLSESQGYLETAPDSLPKYGEITRIYAYDALGRQTHALDYYEDTAVTPNPPRKSGQRTTYNAFAEVTEIGHVHGGWQDALSSLTYAAVETRHYDKAGLMYRKDAADGETRYFYNLAGQITRQEQRGDSAAGTVARISETGYDLLGRAAIQRLPAFVAQSSNLQTPDRTDAITPVIEQSYDRWGNVKQRSQGGFVYNATGQFDTSLRTDVHYSYNADNQVTVERLPSASALREDGTSYAATLSHVLRYDILGRVVQERDLVDDAGTAAVENTELRSRSRRYDAAGQIVSETDATGIVTRHAYDVHGQRVGTLDALGTVLTSTFDLNGNLIQRSVLRQRLSNGTYVRYDNREASQTAEAVTLMQYVYDVANRRITEIGFDAGIAKSRHEIRYDGRNLVTSDWTLGSDGVRNDYTYDGFGNRTSARIGWGTVQQTWAYDNSAYKVGRLQYRELAGGRRTSYAYNAFGQVTQESYVAPFGGGRTYAYRDNGLLQQTTDSFSMGTRGTGDYYNATETTIYAYSALGQRLKETFTRSGEHDVEYYSGDQLEIQTVALAPLERSSRTSYDALGRATQVTATDNQLAAQLQSLTYGYDALGNRRRIQAQYVRVPGDAQRTSDKWYTYDREGRMTGVDLESPWGSGHTGTLIDYDAAGRRASATARWVPRRVGLPPVTYYDHVVQRYSYDDLGRATLVKEVTIDGETGDESAERNFLQQTYDDLGRLVEQKSFETGSGRLLSKTNTTYGGAGRVIQQDVTVYKADGTIDAEHSSVSGNYQYDSAGNLKSYIHTQGAGTSATFNNAYAYGYTREFDGDKESWITVVSTQPNARNGLTSNVYDVRGRLLEQTVHGDGGRVRKSFGYDGEGHIVLKDEFRTQPNTPTGYGREYYFYANGQEVAVVGTGDLVGNTRFGNGYTPISSAYPASTPGTYVVNRGDTLSGIAQMMFGDGALWYLIADANGLSFGPSAELPVSEQGKTYRIPNVVGNLHNNAKTFHPYNPAQIIGATTPAPTLRPEHCAAQGALLLAQAISLAVSVALQTIATVALTPVMGAQIAGAVGGAVGGASGNALNQGIANLSGRQNGFDWDQFGAATMQGAVAGFAAGFGPNQASTLSESGKYFARLGLNTLGQVAGQALTMQTPSFDWKGMAASAAGAALQQKASTMYEISPSVGAALSAGGSLATQALLGEKVNYASAASNYIGGQIGGVVGDYFGNALGNAIAEAMRPPERNSYQLSANISVDIAGDGYGNPYLNESQALVTEASLIDHTLTGDSREGLSDVVALDPSVQKAIALAGDLDGMTPEVVIMTNWDTPAQKLYASKNSRGGVMSYRGFVNSMRNNPWFNPRDAAREFIEYRLRRSAEIDRNFKLMDGYSKFGQIGAMTVLSAGMAASPMGLATTTVGMAADWGVTLSTGDSELGSKVGMATSLTMGLPGIVKYGLGRLAQRSIVGEVHAPAVAVQQRAANTVPASVISGEVLASEIPAAQRAANTVPIRIIEVGGNVQTSGVGRPAPEMLKDALDGLSSLPGDAALRTEVFALQAENISIAQGRNWNAMRQAGEDGSSIFAGDYGHAVVISPRGGVYRGNIATPGQFDLPTMRPNYSGLREVVPPENGISLQLQKNMRIEAWRDRFGASGEGYASLVRDLPRGHVLRTTFARNLREMRASGVAVRQAEMGPTIGVFGGESLQSGMWFRYNPGKMRVVDMLEETMHWRQIQAGMPQKGYSPATLEILAKQSILRNHDLPTVLRMELRHDIQRVRDGSYFNLGVTW